MSFDLATNAGGGEDPLSFAILTPRHRAVVGDSFILHVGLSAIAVEKLSSATATVAGVVVPLEKSKSGVSGVISLARRPWGSERIRVRLLDLQGSFFEWSMAVLHDTPPRLTVLEPTPDSVAMPTLPVDVACVDDRPGCVVRIHGPSTGSSEPPLASGQDGFVGMVDLTQSIGVEAIEPGCPLGSCVRIEAQDEAGNLTAVRVPVFIEKPGRLRQLGRLPGRILDLDDTRVLTLQAGATSARLSVTTRATGAIEPIAPPDGGALLADTARLTPTGVIFLAGPGPTVYLLRSGALSNLGLANSEAPKVNGAFAIWSRGPSLYRIDTRAGAPTLVSTSAAEAAIAPDGTVVFRRSDVAWGNLIRDRNGAQVALNAVNTGVSRGAPLTDGTHVVYREALVDSASAARSAAIGLITWPQPPSLLTLQDARRALTLHPGADYQVENGWIAFVDFAGSSLQQVFAREPSGRVARRTDFTTGSGAIDRLAPNGELMVLSGGPGTGSRHFSRPGAAPLEIGTSNGTSYFVNGSWYLALGGTLLSVDTESP